MHAPGTMVPRVQGPFSGPAAASRFGHASSTRQCRGPVLRTGRASTLGPPRASTRQRPRHSLPARCGGPNREGSPSPEFGDPAVHSPSPEVGDPRCPPCQVGAWGPKGDRARWVHGPIGDHRARCADGPEAAPPGAGPGGSKLLCQGEPVGVLEAGLEQGERLTAMERLRQRREVLGGLALGGSPLGVDAGGGIDAQSGQGDAPQGVVGLAVAASVQPVADGLARGGLRRADPAQARSSVASAEVRGWGPDGHGDVVGDALGVPADAAEQRGSEAAEEP